MPLNFFYQRISLLLSVAKASSLSLISYNIVVYLCWLDIRFAVKFLFFLLILLTFTFQTSAVEHDELRIVTYLEAPFAYIKNGKLLGENIEIAKLLAASINLTPLFIHCPFARCLAMVENGQADMILAIKKTPEREKNLLFLTSAHLIQHFPLRFYLLAANDLTINKFDDLTPLTIGVLRGAKYFDQFDQSRVLKKVALTSREQLIKMLLRGRIDTFLEREESIQPLISSAQYQQKFKLADYQYNKAVGSYIAISKHSKIKNYANTLSQHLQQFIDDGTIEKIIAKRPLDLSNELNKN
jgi:polar amino acid transport system substrate-binding protein